MLSVHQLKFDYYHLALLLNVSFELKQGELLHIKGPNGSGKTTLLKLISGLYQPAEGKILFKGHSISSSLTEYHQYLSYIGHKPGFHGALSVLETVHSFLESHSGEVIDIMKSCNIWHLKDEKCAFLSAGQKRRLALSRLLLKDSPLWVLDEPYTALDQDGCDWVNELMLTQLQKGGAIILTSHQSLAFQGPFVKELTLQ